MLLWMQTKPFGAGRLRARREDRPMSDQPGRARNRDLAFDSIVDAYERRIFQFVHRMLGDYEEAADVTQETFISAYRAYAGFRGESSVQTWLCQIALNHCRNAIRRKGRLQSLRIQSLDQPITLVSGEPGTQREIADTTFEPEALVQSADFRERLLAAIDSLPQEYREVVALREVQGLSYNEIAEATGASLDNVKTRLSRARLMLRRKLEPFYRS